MWFPMDMDAVNLRSLEHTNTPPLIPSVIAFSTKAAGPDTKLAEDQSQS